MSNFDLIEKLTLGTDNVETVTIDVNGEKCKVDLRPLNSGELTQLQKIEKKPFQMKFNMGSNGKIRDVEKVNTQSMDISMTDFTDSQAETLYTSVAWSMSIDDTIVTVDDVKGFISGVPEQIFEHVMRISQIENLEIVKQFR